MRLRDSERQDSPFRKLPEMPEPVRPLEHRPDHDAVHPDAVLDLVAVPASDDGDRTAVADRREHAPPEQRGIEDGVDTLGDGLAHDAGEPLAPRKDDVRAE